MGHLDHVTSIPRTAVTALLDELEAKGRDVSLHWSPPADVQTEADRLDALRTAELQRQNLKGSPKSYAARGKR
jgi:hypothetical protein